MAVQGNNVIHTIAIAAMEEIRKKGRQRKRWRDEDEEDLNKMVMTKRQGMVRGCREWKKISLEAQSRQRAVPLGKWKKRTL
jgi:hypothetical protein